MSAKPGNDADDVTSAGRTAQQVDPGQPGHSGHRPAHHSGPGYVANPEAPDFEPGELTRRIAARWLNLVPAEHRHESRESAADAVAELREHARSCREHPLKALWAAHRYSADRDPAVRVASLVLASEALWWLGHFEDARESAQAAVDADASSAQALWRLAVALYRLARFEDAEATLDDLLKLTDQFAPGWALRGQVKVWLNPGSRESGRSDFAAAAALSRSGNTGDSAATWVVPYRMSAGEFRSAVDAEVRTHDAEAGPSGEPVDVVPLPDQDRVERGVDPDVRWHLAGPSEGGGDRDTQFGGLGGDFAAGARSQVPFGDRFVLYQRNIENLCADHATVRAEIARTVAELFDAGLEARAKIAVAGAPEEHAEGADGPDDPAGT